MLVFVMLGEVMIIVDDFTDNASCAGSCSSCLAAAAHCWTATTTDRHELSRFSRQHVSAQSCSVHVARQLGELNCQPVPVAEH